MDFAERIRIDGVTLPDDRLLPLGTSVLKRFAGPASLSASGEDHNAHSDHQEPSRPGQDVVLTFFELATLMAVLAFSEARCQTAIYEVGLGGRLDATNALEPALCVVTNIALDHQEWLGHSLEEIATEKAGIMRAGVPVVLGQRPPHPVLLDAASKTACPAIVLGRDFDLQRDPLPRFIGLGREIALPSLIATPHHHQDNVATALAAALTLSTQGIWPPLDDDMLVQGVEGTQWPGRWTLLPPACVRRLGGERSPRVLLDAAHNPAATTVLVDGLRGSFAEHPIAVVIGTLRDKSPAPMVEEIQRIPSLTRLIVAPVQGLRGLDSTTFCEHAGLPTSAAAPSLEAALKRAFAAVPETGMVVVTGSIYLLGEVISLLSCEHLLRSTTSLAPSKAPRT